MFLKLRKKKHSVRNFSECNLTSLQIKFFSNQQNQKVERKEKLISACQEINNLAYLKEKIKKEKQAVWKDE